LLQIRQTLLAKILAIIVRVMDDLSDRDMRYHFLKNFGDDPTFRADQTPFHAEQNRENRDFVLIDGEAYAVREVEAGEACGSTFGGSSASSASSTELPRKKLIQYVLIRGKPYIRHRGVLGNMCGGDNKVDGDAEDEIKVLFFLACFLFFFVALVACVPDIDLDRCVPDSAADSDSRFAQVSVV
jgi:hypothetical protein